MKAYLVQASTSLDEQGNTLYTATLAVPNLTTEQFISLINQTKILGEVLVIVDEGLRVQP